jgi:DNA-binding transcriptional LysR family regulator
MELRQLRYFVAAAEELSFTNAARRLHVSQPPVSRQIALLEAEIGVRLLERTKQSVKLTEAGHVFLEHARLILSRAETAVSAARRASEGHVGKLSIGYGGYSAYLLPNVLSRFRARYPSVDLALEPLLLPYHRDALIAGKIDLGVVVLPCEDENLNAEPFATDPFLVALPEKHPLGKHRSLWLRQLAEYDFVMFPWTRGSGLGRVAMQVCSRAGFVPRIVQEAAPTESVIGLVGAGVGIALLPAIAERIRIARVEYRTLKDRYAVAKIGIAWRKDDRSPVIQAFLQIARETREQKATGAPGEKK